jgi:hypothetical protein
VPGVADPRRPRRLVGRPRSGGRSGLTLTIELVRRADQRRRWHEVGRVLFADEPRWSPPLRSYERWLVSRRHPYRRLAELDRWLVRRNGAVVGRVAAHHVAGDDLAWFGGFECADDGTAVRALVDAVTEWAVERAATHVRGPALYLPEDGDAGVLVRGFEHAGGTGRPWHPPWYADHLADAGFEPAQAMPRWRLPTGGTAVPLPRGPVPPHAGRLGDPTIAFGAIAAVPDVSAIARGRRQQPAEASVVHLDGDAAVLVPALLAAATQYEAVWAPWTPSPEAAPDTVHQLLEMVADRNRPA